MHDFTGQGSRGLVPLWVCEGETLTVCCFLICNIVNSIENGRACMQPFSIEMNAPTPTVAKGGGELCGAKLNSIVFD